MRIIQLSGWCTMDTQTLVSSHKGSPICSNSPKRRPRRHQFRMNKIQLWDSCRKSIRGDMLCRTPWSGSTYSLLVSYIYGSFSIISFWKISFCLYQKLIERKIGEFFIYKVEICVCVFVYRLRSEENLNWNLRFVCAHAVNFVCCVRNV